MDPDPAGAAERPAGALAAIVLAGGAARRFGGRHKPGVPLGGVPMLDRVLRAVPDARPRVVVGPAQPVPNDVVLVREDPPLGGPAAAVAAGVRAIDPAPGPVVSGAADWPAFVAVLAGDQPLLTPAAIAALLDAIRAAPANTAGAVFVGDGRAQLLCGVWRFAALRARCARLAAGSPPDGARPDGARPDGARGGGAMPGGAMPGGAMPGGARPDGALCGGTAAGAAAGGGAAAGRAAAGRNAAGRATGGGEASGGGGLTGCSIRRLLGGLDHVSVVPPSGPPPWYDCDEPDDVARAARLLPSADIAGLTDTGPDRQVGPGPDRRETDGR